MLLSSHEAAAGDALFVPRIGDLPGAPRSPDRQEQVLRRDWDGQHLLWYRTLRPDTPVAASILSRSDSPERSRETFTKFRESYVNATGELETLVPGEPGVTFAAISESARGDSESWAADAVAADKRVGNVLLERKGRHVLLFECRGIWLPPGELKSAVAPFLARMEEWPPVETAPAAPGP